MQPADTPQKSTNVEIGTRLKLERQRLGFAQSEFGVLAGVSKTSQFNYEAGDRMPDAAYLALAASHGADVLYIVTGQRSASSQDGFASIPILPIEASAGPGAVNESLAPYHPAQDDGMCFSRQWLNRRQLSPAQLAVITVRGSSMDGVLSDGDQVLIDKSDTKPRSSFVYVIRQGDELMVKFCQLLPGGLLRLSSANPRFAPFDVDLSHSPDVQIVGRVVASMHEW
ncbi:MAG: LexA family transcriptional regulator [Burkholderiaceae bacterium]|nr:LexA family transcriptional regulator [Burkholderiaceae bacterium]